MLDLFSENPKIAIAIIGFLGAVVGIFISPLLGFIFNFYVSERIRRRWKMIEVKRQYSSQIIRASDELASRLENLKRFLAGRQATTWLRPISEKEMPNIPFNRYYFSSTIYLFCRLVGWIEILKREQIFLDCASVKETRIFNSYLELIYSIISYAGLTGSAQERSKGNHWIYLHYLGGLGQSFFIKDQGEPLIRCLTFQEFCSKYKDRENADFKGWIREAEKLFVDLNSDQDDDRWARLQMLWFCLDQFLLFADPKQLRTTRDRAKSMNIPNDLKQKIKNQAEWHRLEQLTRRMPSYFDV